MKKPDEQVEKEFNKAGIFFYENESFFTGDDENPRIGVEVEIGMLPDAKPLTPDFLVAVKNRRGVVTMITDWTVKERGDQKVLTFIAWQRIPSGALDDGIETGDTVLATSFLDFCYYSGNEDIDPTRNPDVFTQVRDACLVTDLGWHLPSRFVDPLIDSLGKLNDFMLGGTLEDSMLYGVLFRNKTLTRAK
jgi:hypothetical protein